MASLSRLLRFVALLAITACAGAPRTSADTRLRAVTYNIQAGAGNLDTIASVIRSLNADIIGLQEVDVHWSSRSNFADQVATLGSRLGMQVRFAPIYRLPGSDATKPYREFGVAILSRHPIVEFRNDTLTRLSTQDTGAGPTLMPGLAEAVVNVNGQRIRVFATHLDYRADPRVRATQALEMRRYVDASADPTIVFGDLNATPEAPELRPLFESLRDVWAGQPEVGLTYPATQPIKRIDYILVSDGFKVLSASVVPVTAADHRPVVADLFLSNRP